MSAAATWRTDTNIESAKVEIQDGWPVLVMIIDGHRAEVVEPKLTLLGKGIVVLLDGSERYWESHISVELPADPTDGRPEPTLFRGATNDPGVVSLVRRFVAGEDI